MTARADGATWWTLEEVQAYLRHERIESSEVWLTRHGIKAVRHYRVRDVTGEREKPRARPRQAG